MNRVKREKMKQISLSIDIHCSNSDSCLKRKSNRNKNNNNINWNIISTTNTSTLHRIGTISKLLISSYLLNIFVYFWCCNYLTNIIADSSTIMSSSSSSLFPRVVVSAFTVKPKTITNSRLLSVQVSGSVQPFQRTTMIRTGRVFTSNTNHHMFSRFSSYSSSSVHMSSTKDASTDVTTTTTTTGPVPYPFQDIEKKWQGYWEENGTFITSSDRTKPIKKYVLDMFPYPSGAGLHVGHPEGYTASDVMARYWRMKQYDVLHPIGWDSFGLPAEQFAIQTGTQPAVTTANNIANFKRQLKMLGFSYDWTREVATTDPTYFKWTQWIFLQLYKTGLAEQSSVAVNWCPALGTVLANEEVIDGLSERGSHPVERLPLRQWVLKITKYADKLESGLANLNWPAGTMTAQKQWIGKSTGTRIKFPLQKLLSDDNDNTEQFIEVFTTRPDTIMGVTYVTLAPEHPLVSVLTTVDNKETVDAYVREASARSDLDRTAAKDKTGAFTGSYVQHPLQSDTLIPVWVGDYVLGSYGTGAVMAVPAHDSRDYAFATKYELPIEYVIKPTENDTIDANADDSVACAGPGAFTEYGILYNSGSDLDGLTSDEAKAVITSKLSDLNLGGSQTTYKLRDWIFSRQRYWGEPIPIYFPVDFPDNVDPLTQNPIIDESCDHSIRYDQPIPVDENDLPLQLPIMEEFQPGTDPAGCLARVKEWRYFKKDGKWYARETNTMPQWAGSCWYYFRFLDPNNNDMAFSKQVDADWMPVDLYVGGSEHAVLHLLYARFWHQVLYDLGYTQHPEPFHKLVHQGMILGSDGEKMSKSRGNVVNPDDIVLTNGADALRLYEMFMGPLEAVKPWQTEQVAGVVRFMNRLYNVVVTAANNKHTDIDTETSRIMHKTIKKVTEDIESMSFNTAISALMVFTNHLQSLPKDKIPLVAVQNLALMVSPFAPHLGEECWSILQGDSSSSGTLAYYPWVEYDESFCIDNEMTMGVQINGKTRSEITIPTDATKDDAVAAAQQQARIQSYTEGKTIVKVIYVPGRILNIIVK